jgi:hypothetical protein
LTFTGKGLDSLTTKYVVGLIGTGVFHAIMFYLLQYPNPLGERSHEPRLRAPQSPLEAFVLREREPSPPLPDDQVV